MDGDVNGKQSLYSEIIAGSLWNGLKSQRQNTRTIPECARSAAADPADNHENVRFPNNMLHSSNVKSNNIVPVDGQCRSNHPRGKRNARI
jgi:hypothetical protein